MQITIEDCDIVYETHGQGVPVLILHGWGMNRAFMSGCMESAFLPELDTSFMRIYLDLPGMGESKAGKSLHNSDDMLRILKAFVTAVIPGKSFIIVGESYGGLLARGFVYESINCRTSPFYGKLNGAFLLCPCMIPGWRQGTVVPLSVMEKDEEFLASLSEEERASFTYLNVRLTRPVWERYKKEVIPALNQGDHHFLDHVLDGAFSFDVDNLPVPFAKPALILTGRQDTEVGYEDQFTLLKKYPRATYVTLDCAGHNAQIEQPELFAALVQNWFMKMR